MSPERSQEIPKTETAPNFAVLPSMDFLKDFYTEAKIALRSSKDTNSQDNRLWLQSMLVAYGYTTKWLFYILEEAKDKGFDSRLVFDYYSVFSPDGASPLLPFSKHRLLARNHNQHYLNRLIECGVNIAVTNSPKTFSRERVEFWRGRNHKKVAIITTGERQVAWLGGVNFFDKGLYNIDYMIKLDDPRIVSAIKDEFPRINENRRTEDTIIQCSQDTSLIIDCGRRGESIILDKAIQEVKGAKQKITCISELEPEGKFLQVLTQAYKRNVEITFITNGPSQEGPELKAKRIVDMLTLKRKNPDFLLIHPELWVHAKLLIVDNKTVIAGSHNFSPSTVNYGTEEAALLSTNPTLVGNAIRYTEDITSSHLTATRDRIQ